MVTPRTAPGENATALERIVFFSDAVFAIAITLLALEIRLPELADPAEFPHALRAALPAILAFAISFLVIGSYWLAHHRIFTCIERYDRRLLWLNLLVLLGVAFVPFPTSLLARYGDLPLAAIVYAATLALTGLLLGALWTYATWGHRLVAPTLPAAIIRANTIRLYGAAGLFLLSIGVAATLPFVAEASWALVLFIRPAADHLADEAADPPAVSPVAA